MKGLDRYILRQLAGPMVFLTLGLTGIVWLTQSLRFVDMIVNRGLSAAEFLYITFLLMPGILVLILPIALFCAILYAYHRLGNDSEIIVMRAAGLSQRSLAVPAVIVAVITALATYALTLYLTPLGFRTFKDRQFTVRSNFASVLIQEGVFNELMEGITVYVRARGSSGELLGILVHDNRDTKEPVTIMAERGLLVDTSDGPRFIMENGNRQVVGQDTRQLSLLYFEKYALDLGLIAASPENRWREAGERYLDELWNPGTGHDDKKNADRFLAEAHKRLTMPLHAIVFALIAVAGLLSGDFNRRSEWRRIATVSILALAFEIASLALVPLIGKTPSLAPLMYVNVALAWGLSIWWLGKSRFGRRASGRDKGQPVNA